MSKQVCYVRMGKDKVEVGSADNKWHTYFIKNLKFNPKAENALPAVCVDILGELEHAQDLGYDIRFEYTN